MKQGIPPGKPSKETLQENIPFLNAFLRKILFFASRQCLLMVLHALEFSGRSMIPNESEITSRSQFGPETCEKSGFWCLVSISWGWGNRWPGPGGTLEGHHQSQPLRNCIRTLERYLKVSLVRELCYSTGPDWSRADLSIFVLSKTAPSGSPCFRLTEFWQHGHYLTRILQNKPYLIYLQ